jgi:hypothetical protein
LFNEDDAQSEKTNKKLNSENAFEVQTEIIHYVTIHEVVTTFLTRRLIPHFKHEKAENYRKIMKQVSIV